MNDEVDFVKNVLRTLLALIAILMMTIGGILILGSCTLNMIMTHTEGSASDIVDSSPSTKADVSPDISLPVLP